MWWDVGTGRVPAAIHLPIASDDLAELRRWARSSRLPAVVARRARILLLAADGVSNTEIPKRVEGSRPTVITWRRRYVRRGDFPSVDDLTTTISRFCQSWNQHCQPFSWTKPADQILAKLHRQGTSARSHELWLRPVARRLGGDSGWVQALAVPEDVRS